MINKEKNKQVENKTHVLINEHNIKVKTLEDVIPFGEIKYSITCTCGCTLEMCVREYFIPNHQRVLYAEPAKCKKCENVYDFDGREICYTECECIYELLEINIDCALDIAGIQLCNYNNVSGRIAIAPRNNAIIAKFPDPLPIAEHSV